MGAAKGAPAVAIRELEWGRLAKRERDTDPWNINLCQGSISPLRAPCRTSANAYTLHGLAGMCRLALAVVVGRVTVALIVLAIITLMLINRR
jgi:hypothetical protein